MALNVDDDRRRVVRPRRESRVFHAVDDIGDVGNANRRAVLVRDDQALVLVGRFELVVGIDRRRACRPVEAPLRLIDIRAGDRSAQVVEAQAVRSQRARIHLHTDGGSLAATGADQAHAGKLRDLLCDPRVDEIEDLRQRERRRRNGQRQDRRVGRVHLAVDRRLRQIGRQQVSAGVDRRLHFLFRNVEAQ